jgi:hypothetical protein
VAWIVVFIARTKGEFSPPPATTCARVTEPEFPGAQRRYRRVSAFAIGELLTELFVLLLLAQAFIRQNVHTASWVAPYLWRLHILDTSIAATLAIGLITLRLAREQFVRGSRPYLVYSIDSPKKADDSLLLDETDAVILVSLINFGPGLAIITKANASLTFRAPTERYDRVNLVHLEKLLRDRGLQAGSDYSLRYVDHGFSLGGGGSREAILEMTDSFISRVARLDLELVFESPLGERYEKRLFCIPRRLEVETDAKGV